MRSYPLELGVSREITMRILLVMLLAFAARGAYAEMWALQQQEEAERGATEIKRELALAGG